MSARSAKRQLKLGGGTVGAGGHGTAEVWRHPEIPGDASVNIAWYTERVRELEAACFDFVFVSDAQFVTPDSFPGVLNRFEPLTLLAALAVSTTHIGVVGTVTTSFTPPFLAARQFASLDLISGGRAGWNVVTTGEGGTVANYGLDEHYDYATRYARALEHVEIVRGLWDSYEDDAFPRDRDTGVFLDPSRQHRLDHRGTYFSVAGPLNVARSRQGQPVIFQAGSSEEGRDLGATIGEVIFTLPGPLEDAQGFYRDMKHRASAKGRNPDQILILPGLTFTLGDTDEQARQLNETRQASKDFSRILTDLGRPFGWHDFSQYDLDAPFPDVSYVADRHYRSKAARIVRAAREGNLTLRETAHYVQQMDTAFVGCARTVADDIERWFLNDAADGFILTAAIPSDLARFANEVLPILRERGLFRDRYESDTLRGNLGLKIPPNVHTSQRDASRV